MGSCHSSPQLSSISRRKAAAKTTSASYPRQQAEITTSAPPPQQSRPDDRQRGRPTPHHPSTSSSSSSSSQQRYRPPQSDHAPATPSVGVKSRQQSWESTPVKLILSMTSNKPLDARDVRDGDEIASNDAKTQIQRIRELADEFLKTNALNMGENMAVEEEDENGDANYVARDKGDRDALYDKQDLSTFVKIQKTADVQSLIYDAIKPNALFEIFANEEIMQIIDVFKPETFKDGKVIIRQGDMGSEFYVVESGELIEQVEGGVSKARVYARGDAFGEVALVFGSPSAATITATADVRVWILERNVYSSVISSIRREQYQEKQEFLRDCLVGDRPFFTIFDFHQIEDLAIAAKVDNFEEGEVILREGEIVEAFYIVRSGTIERYKTNRAAKDEKAGTIDEGKCFGTTALLKQVGSPFTYMASSRVKVFYLTRHDFESIIGSVKDAFENNTVMPSVSRSIWRDASRSTIATRSSQQSLYKCDLDDLNIYNVLGHGAFGHVMLVQLKKSKRLFALKAQAKHNICRKKLQDRILNEFVIATQVEHKNLLRIHCAIQDEKYVYFLLDLLPGGMLMDYLMKNPKRSSGRAFDEEDTKFYAASVVLAFEQLHNLMIAYRDLKPENIVLNKKGYGVLVDFGLAKDVEGLTYTFCGTPDYLSPEIIRRTGHNWAVDYWTLGVFLFEMTKGTPPFYSRSPMERERKILKGFECVHVPSYFTSGLSDLISQLLITDQSKRLGRTQNGIQGIKNHRWFAGFDWEGFEKQSLNAPILPKMPSDLKELGHVMDYKRKQEINATPSSEWWPNLTLHLGVGGTR